MRSSGVSLTSFLNRSFMAREDLLHPELAAERLARSADYEARQRGNDAINLPARQQAALLQMYESHVKRAVIARLLEDSQAAPGLDDFRTLVARGLAIRNMGKRFHELTPAGLLAVRHLEPALCQRFNIHLLIEVGQVDWQQKYQCTCGKSYFVRRSPTAPGNARRQWAAEHATADGMAKLVAALKPPQMAEG